MQKIVNGVTLQLTPEEIDAASARDALWDTEKPQRDLEEAYTKRSSRYLTESDPLRAEWDYERENGNPDHLAFRQKWLDKVSQIKTEIPLN